MTQLTADLAAANTRIAALVAGTDEVQLTPVETAANAASDAAATAANGCGCCRRRRRGLRWRTGQLCRPVRPTRSMPR